MTRQTETFARRVREARSRAGLSQALLAERINPMLDHTIDHSAIARIERHQRGARLPEAIAIADVLDVTLASLLREKDAIDVELGELRRDLDLARYRADQAEVALRDSRDAVEGIRRRIAELEASRGD